MTDLPQQKIDGLIALMKGGIYEGERNAAERALKRICEKYEINFDDLLYKADEEPEEYSLPYKNEEEGQVLAHCLRRYAKTKDIWKERWRRRRRLYFKCLPSKHIEACIAWDVLKVAYREEREIFQRAFINKHNLFGDDVKTAPEPKTKEEMERLMRMVEMMRGMRSVSIHRQLSAPR